MSRFDEYLNHIEKSIRITDEDTQTFTQDFKIIRDYVINTMKSDEAFRKLYRGTSLYGSYANNVRINTPDEFDVILTLVFPNSSWIEINEDEDRPGFINIDLAQAMLGLQPYTDDDGMYDFLQSRLVGRNDDLLRQTNLTRWIRGLISDGLEYPYNSVRGAWGDVYKLKYSQRGLAHTISAQCPRRNMSIDFIVGIQFGRDEWMQLRPCDPFKWQCKRWYAVPKTSAGPRSSKAYTFMICNPHVEHDLLFNKQNLKLVFRLLKSLRDKYNMPHLKSYFLATAFLLEIETDDGDDFWYEDLSEILVYMLHKLFEYFSNGFLPFFWDRNFNLLGSLHNKIREDCAQKLYSAYKTLKTYRYQSRLGYKACLRHFEVPNC